mmetsp:Transcript_67862/g.147785  ORF Transcript_67862/g.147785 Transcript_67862/m.147785 type:complete len:250 (-) Transcript_67862:634-1383(-)
MFSKFFLLLLLLLLLQTPNLDVPLFLRAARAASLSQGLTSFMDLDLSLPSALELQHLLLRGFQRSLEISLVCEISCSLPQGLLEERDMLPRLLQSSFQFCHSLPSGLPWEPCAHRVYPRRPLSHSLGSNREDRLGELRDRLGESVWSGWSSCRRCFRGDHSGCRRRQPRWWNSRIQWRARCRRRFRRRISHALADTCLMGQETLQVHAPCFFEGVALLDRLHVLVGHNGSRWGSKLVGSKRRQLGICAL